jgi:hypothetical protein
MVQASTSRKYRGRHIARIAAVASILSVGTIVSAESHAVEVAANPLQKPGWVLDRNDEFNGALDSSLWRTNYLESRTTAARSSAVYGFRNNALVLRIDDNQPTYYSDNPMKVSSIQTGQMTGLHKTTPLDHTIPTIWNYTPKYGYFEIRAKTSARSGLHAAFWAVGKQDTSSQNAEIDVIEDPGPNTSSFLFNVHKWSDPNVAESSSTVTTGFNITNEMHIYGLEWTPSQLKLYVDNVLTRTVNTSPAYQMVFLLSLYENAGWTGTVDPTDTRPKEFVIDYFRAYKPVFYRITNRNSGKVMDVQSPNTSRGAKVGQWTANGQPWQDWQFLDRGNGYYNIVSRNSGKCLDVSSASTADGAQLLQWDCGSGTNQQFQWVATGSYFQLRARHSGKCVNVVGGSTADGALLEQRTCGTANSFQWSRS